MIKRVTLYGIMRSPQFEEFFLNYEEAPRSLFFLNIHGGMRAKWRKKRMRRLQETTQETENISHQVHLLHLLIEFKRLAEGLAGGCQGQQTLLL
jgi:hypothetical protein